MDSVTVEDLDLLIKAIATSEKAIEATEALLSEQKKVLNGLEIQAVSFLKERGCHEYVCADGKVTIKEHWSVKTPKTPEAKEALFSWMREKGIFEAYATVNANSLKALFKTERELAIQNGEDPLLFTLPGLEPGTVFEGLDFKPKKEQVDV